MRAVFWLLQGLPRLRKPRWDLSLMSGDWVSSVCSTCPPAWLWVLVITSYKLAVWNIEWVKAWSLLEKTFLPQLYWSANCARNSIQALPIVLCGEDKVKHVLAFELHLLLLSFLMPLGWLLCANTCLPEEIFKISAQLKLNASRMFSLLTSFPGSNLIFIAVGAFAGWNRQLEIR